MAYPQSKHYSARFNRRLRGRQSGQWMVVAAGAALGSLAVYSFLAPRRASPSSVVLTLDLSTPPAELNALSLLSLASVGRPNHYNTLRVLEYAAKDNKVRGLMAKVGGGAGWSLAQAQEIRQAIERFSQSGKFAHAFADTLGEGGEANTGYYLASGFDKVYLQPCGEVNLLGYRVNAPFLRTLLDRLGILPQFVIRKEYKNAANALTETGFTPAHKESVTSILSSIYRQLLAGIAAGRGKTTQAVDELMSDGPFSAAQAQERGLVDGLVYENELIPLLKHTALKEAAAASGLLPPHIAAQATLPQHSVSPLASSSSSSASAPPPAVHPSSTPPSNPVLLRDVLLPLKTRLQRFDQYASTALKEMAKEQLVLTMRGAPKIALIYALGQCTTQSPASSLTPGLFHSSTLVKAITKAASNRRVHVILLRIDSPGGSYVAADSVHAALQEAKAQGKKVVVSMGGVAASGGYFAAAPADCIFANAATLTGSIGVFGGKLALRGFLNNRLHITIDSLQVGGGDTAGLYSLVDPWSPPQLRRINDMLDRIYADFVSKVAAGRGLSFDTAESLAHGRVWTGEQARKLGLVDELGGLWDAVQRCKAMIPRGRELAVVEVMPRRRGLLGLLQDTSQDDPEKDDRPLFSYTESAAAAAVEAVVREGVGVMEAGAMRELQATLRHAGLGGLGGLDADSVNVHAGSGMLGETGLIDRKGNISF